MQIIGLCLEMVHKMQVNMNNGLILHDSRFLYDSLIWSLSSYYII